MIPVPPPAVGGVPYGTPNPERSSSDVVVLLVSIFFPFIGLIVGLYIKRQMAREGRPSSQMATLSLVIAAVLFALQVVAAIIILVFGFSFSSLAPQLSSSSPVPVASPTKFEAEITEAELAEAKNVIVLRPVAADGKSLTSSRLEAARSVIERRLDRAQIEFSKVAFGQGRLYIIFFYEADPEAVSRAAQLVSGELRLELRQVLTIGECTDRSSAVVEDAQGGIVACSRDSYNGNDGYESYALGPVAVSGDRIRDTVALASDGQSSTGEWFVSITFDAQGARAFADLTTKLVSATGPSNQLAMVLDGEVLSAPRVLAVITDGKVQISGSFAQKNAESLAAEFGLASRGLSFTVEKVTTLE